MKKRFSLLLTLCLTLSFVWAQTTSPKNLKETSLVDTPYVIAEEATFFIVHEDACGNAHFTKTTLVPYKEDQLYQWELKVYSNLEKIRYTEVYTLPKAPKTWGFEDFEGSPNRLAYKVSQDRKTVTVHREVSDDQLAGTWSIAKGDPKGHHKVAVYVEDRLLHIFHFEVR